MIAEWKASLVERGVYVDTDRGRLQTEAFIDLLYRRSHIGKRNRIEKNGAIDNTTHRPQP